MQSGIATNFHDTNDNRIIKKVAYTMLIADGWASMETLEHVRSGSDMSDTLELLETSVDLAVIAAWEASRAPEDTNKFMARKLLSDAKRYRRKYPHKVELTIGSSEWKEYVGNQMGKAVAILDSIKEDEVQATMAERSHETNDDRNIKELVNSIIIADGYSSLGILEAIRSESDLSDTLELLEISIDQAVVEAWNNRASAEEYEKSMALKFLSDAQRYRNKYPRKVESSRVRSGLTDYMSNQIEKATVIIEKGSEWV